MNSKPPLSSRRQFLAQTTSAAGATALLLAPRSSAQEPRPLFIEGYTGQTSYAPGDEVTFHVSTTASVFTVEIARVGQKTEVVWTKADVPGAAHAVPEHASSKG